MSDIFNEISEELQKENLALLAKKYGKPVIIAIFLVILAAAVFIAQQGYLHSKQEKAASDYLAAMQMGPGDQGLAALTNLSMNASHPIKDIAALKAAGFLLEKGKKPEALNLYDKVSQDSDSDKSFRNLATIILAKNTLGDPEEEKKYNIKSRLEAISGNESPFRSFTYELLALIGIENHNNDEARKNLLLLTTDPTSAEWTKKRAEELLTLPSYE